MERRRSLVSVDVRVHRLERIAWILVGLNLGDLIGVEAEIGELIAFVTSALGAAA